MFADAAYVRAILGSVAVVLPVVAALLALVGIHQVDGLFLTPALSVLIPICVIGVFDALAGLLGMLVFGIGLIATAGLSSFSDLRFLLGMCLLGFAPGFLASSFRGIRRPEAISSHELYERAIDLLVAPLLAGWATIGIVSALPALAGAKLPIEEHAKILGACVAVAMLVRVLLEETTVRNFPNRLKTLNPSDLSGPALSQKLLSLVVRMGLFFFVSLAFVGHCWQLYFGTIVFIIPSFVNLYRDKFPNYPKLYHALPAGLPGLAFSLLIASAFLAYLQSAFGETPEFAKIAFALLPIPGLILSLLTVIGRSPAEGDVRWYLRPNNLWIYRIGGVLVFLATLKLTKII